jgi:PAS domain S-box-containing protein
MKTLMNTRSTHPGFWKSIQGNLILLLLLLLVPTLLIQAYVYRETLETRRAEELQANLEIARTVAKAFDTFIQDVLHQELTIELALTSRQALPDEDRTRILNGSLASNSALWQLFWVNPAGTVIAATGPEFIGINFADRQYYQEIVAGRDWAVSDLLLSRTTGQPSFTISRGIRDEGGELLGVIIAGILPERLDAVLGVDRSKGAAVSVVDSKGMLVYRYPNRNLSWEERDWLKSLPQLQAALDGKEIAWIGKPAVGDKTRIMANVPIGSVGWSGGAGRTEEDAMAAAASTLLPQASVFLLVSLTAFGIALALSHSISSPVKRLRNHALALGRGEIDIPVVISGPAEIEDLAYVFHEMAETVRSRELALGESEEKFRLLFQSIPEPLALASWVEGRILEVNEAYCRCLGFSQEELIGKTSVDLGIWPDMNERTQIRDILASEPRVSDFECLLKTKSGNIKTVILSVELLEMQGERSMLFTIKDITERKQSEEALRKAHERALWLARFPEENPNPVAQVSGEGHVVYCNPAAAELPEWVCEAGNMLPDQLLPLVKLALAKGLVAREDIPLGERFYSVLVAPFPAECYANVYGVDITERKRAEELLLNHAAELEAVFAAQNDAVLVYDTKMNARRVNPSFLSLYGFDPVGLNLNEIIQRVSCRWLDGRPFVLEDQPTPRALSGEKVAGAYFVITRSDGTEAVVETSSGPMRVKDVVTGSVTVWHDITALKQMEEEICRARDVLEIRVQERTRELVMAEDAVQRANRALRTINACNEALIRDREEQDLLNHICEIIVQVGGYRMAWVGFAEPDEIRKVRLLAYAGYDEGYLEAADISWADTERGRGPTGLAIREGKIHKGRNIQTQPNLDPWRAEALRRGYASSIALPLMVNARIYGALTIYASQPDAFNEEETKLLASLADNLSYGIASIHAQIERKRAEEEIVRTQTMLQKVFDGISDPLLLVGKDFVVKVLNEASCRYFQVNDTEEAIGKTCCELARGRCASCDDCVIHSAILKGERVTFERKGLFEPERVEQITVYPCDDAADGTSEAIIRISDITEIKNLEKHMMHVDRLSSLGQLSGGIAHEIRNPLAGINLFVDALSDEEKFARTNQELNILEEIKSNIKKINGIIKRVLDFSRQSKTASRSKLEIGSLIEDTLKLWRPRIGREGIELRLFVEEDLPDIFGDSIEIQQVLNNLVDNAIDVMSGGGLLSIAARRCTLSAEKKRPAVSITVQDSGSGIPVEAQDSIFNPFFTTKPTGTGLGLAISHRIISRHGGIIFFETAANVGTTFHIEFPVASGG